MSEARPTLLYATEETRSDRDRREGPRRAPKRPLDPLFAATLVNQVAPAEEVYAQGYPPKRAIRAGIAIDVRA